jgi:hypothetical protein
MALITRQGKGSKLTSAEMDGNLEYLESMGRPYKVYTALLTQSGTNAPVATVLENTLGGDIVWSRNSEGDYSLTLTGAFILDKTYYTIHNNSNPLQYDLYFTSGDINTMTIYSTFYGVAADEAFYFTPIEIRVYN